MESGINSYEALLDVAASTLLSRMGPPPAVAIALGSGLGGLFDSEVPTRSLPFSEIDGFLDVETPGHAGCLTRVSIEGLPVCLVQGRVHAYEGHSLREVVFPVRAIAKWGVSTFILTNAAGSIKVDFSPGDLMVVSDHLNLLGANPLVGHNIDSLGPRFPDQSEVYCRRLRDLARQAADEAGISLRHGVYAAVLGPNYESPAEIRMLRTLGADAVGMSTVPEAIALNHMGTATLAISCITNMAAGMEPGRLRHEGVLDTGRASAERLEALLRGVIGKIASELNRE